MSINEIVSAYIAAKAEKAAAEKREKAMKALIIQHAHGAEYFETDDFRVMISKRKRTGIDTEKLYADFPEMKDVYGQTSFYDVITPAEKTDAEKARSAAAKSA